VTGIAITVVNTGVRSFTVQNIRFFAAEGSFPGVKYEGYDDDAKLPHRLLEHEQALFRYELNEYFHRLTSFVVETTARNVTVELAEWDPGDATDTSRLTDLPGPKVWMEAEPDETAPDAST
jgi:hypothetical protein